MDSSISHLSDVWHVSLWVCRCNWTPSSEGQAVMAFVTTQRFLQSGRWLHTLHAYYYLVISCSKNRPYTQLRKDRWVSSYQLT